MMLEDDDVTTCCCVLLAWLLLHGLSTQWLLVPKLHSVASLGSIQGMM
jgi:hypothetical protein